MEAITFDFDGQQPPKAIIYRYCPKDPGNHWKVGGDMCPVCRSKIEVVTYIPVPALVAHMRQYDDHSYVDDLDLASPEYYTGIADAVSEVMHFVKDKT